MKATNTKLFNYSAIALALASAGLPTSVTLAQTIDKEIEKIEITATRRTGTVLDGCQA
jgi:iron complex outermembrane recepter protein